MTSMADPSSSASKKDAVDVIFQTLNGIWVSLSESTSALFTGLWSRAVSRGEERCEASGAPLVALAARGAAAQNHKESAPRNRSVPAGLERQ